MGVVPAVADEQALAVPDDAPLAGEVADRRVVLVPDRDGLAEATGGSDRPREQIRGRAASRLAEQPALQDRAHAVLPGVERDDGAVRQHHGDVRVGVGDRIDERDLLRGQVHAGAVVALRLVGGGQPQEQQDHLGVRCQRDRLGHERGVRILRVDDEGGREDDLAVGQRRGQRVERGVEPGRVHLRRPGALVPRCPGELADHGDPTAARGQRQQVAVVLQQHRGRGRGLPGQRVVGVDVERCRLVLQRRLRLRDEPEHPLGRTVHIRLRQAPLPPPRRGCARCLRHPRTASRGPCPRRRRPRGRSSHPSPLTTRPS